MPKRRKRSSDAEGVVPAKRAKKSSKLSSSAAAALAGAGGGAAAAPKASKAALAAKKRAEDAMVTKVVDLITRQGRVTTAQLSAEFGEAEGQMYTSALQTLQSQGRLKVLNSVKTNELMFELATESERNVKQKLGGNSLSKSARFAYQMIEQTADRGVWTRTLRKQTGLQPAQMNKVLKDLERLELVRAWTLKNRKTYMLWDLKPAPDLGFSGPFFDNGTLDKIFIEQMYQLTLEYIGRCGRKGTTLSELMQRLVPAMVNESSGTRVEGVHMQQLLDVLLLDRVVERMLLPEPAAAAAAAANSAFGRSLSSSLSFNSSASGAGEKQRNSAWKEGDQRTSRAKRRYTYRVIAVVDADECTEVARRAAATTAAAQEIAAELASGAEGRYALGDSPSDAHVRRISTLNLATRSVAFRGPGGHLDTLTITPCGVCPHAERCTPGALVSPSTCVYLPNWLHF
jgi:hypothetical protein